MIIQNLRSGRENEILRLYEAVGWTAYLSQPERIKPAFDHSLCVLELCDEQDRLMGFVRAVGDGETILYIQDLIVDPSIQNQGWGTAFKNHVGQISASPSENPVERRRCRNAELLSSAGLAAGNGAALSGIDQNHSLAERRKFED